MKKLIVVLPAFNEEKTIAQVLEDLKKELNKIANINKEIVVVDDGSWDKTAEIAESKKATVLCHPINRGLGGALRTGIEYARVKRVDFLITFDADGQHDPKDIHKIIKPLLKNTADVVIGIRNIRKMPLDRRVITFVSTIVTFVFFGIYCQDTQSGFRAFNKKALDKMGLKTQKMEVSSEFFHEIKKNKLCLAKAPIKVIYTQYSREKGQKNSNAIEVLVKLALRLFR